MTEPNCTVRWPYHERFGMIVTQQTAFDAVDYDAIPPIPETLMEPGDWSFSQDDEYRMATLKTLGDDPVVDYWGHRQVQEGIIAEEHAAERLRRDRPDIYQKLLDAVVLNLHNKMLE